MSEDQRLELLFQFGRKLRSFAHVTDFDSLLRRNVFVEFLRQSWREKLLNLGTESLSPDLVENSIRSVTLQALEIHLFGNIYFK